jgi:NAD(P)-dependent dehydrogenase (short-subunit alcohol dehydrogenase family)
MPGLVDGKVAVITGGSSGIGRAAAFALAAEGARAIVIADIRKDPREGGTPTHEAVGCDARFVMCDVSKPADLQAAVAAADEFGGLDIMVNNAGIVVMGDFLEFTEEQYDRQLNVNAKGVFFGTQAAAQRMVAKGGGSIINVSSVLGMVGNGAVVAYSASKGAIKTITYSAANYLATQGVRVNAVHPGVVGTELVTGDFGLPMEAATQVFPIPIGRPSTAQDVSGTIVFLASDMSTYMTGSSLVVDGGMITSM